MSTSGKPDPEREAKMLAKLLSEDPAKLDVASDEEVVRQMDAAGVEAGSVPTVEEMVARTEKRAAVPPARPPSVRPAPEARTSSLWLVAAALLVLLVLAWWKGPAVVAYFRGEPIRPDDERMLPRTPEERAATLRQEALAACGLALWGPCRTKLDAARDLDPAGDSAPEVTAARKQIDAAQGKVDGGDGPKPP